MYEHSRRSFIKKMSLAPVGLLFADPYKWAKTFIQIQPDSKFSGVQIGVITYSFRTMPGSINEVLMHTVNAGIGAVELMGHPVELYAGKPVKADKQQIAAWRASVAMDKFREVRHMFDKAGVSIYAYKQPDALKVESTDAEIEYVMRAAKILGAKSITVELPKEHQHTQRLGDLARKHQVYVGYHTHTQATDTIWDTALSQSPYNSINLDCGHYIAAGGENTKESLLNLITARHNRITSLHMKDRETKPNGGANLRWGEGDTPIKDILLLLKRKKYNIPVSIELEYKIPEKSNAVIEVRKCAEYARKILEA